MFPKEWCHNKKLSKFFNHKSEINIDKNLRIFHPSPENDADKGSHNLLVCSDTRYDFYLHMLLLVWLHIHRCPCRILSLSNQTCIYMMYPHMSPYFRHCSYILRRNTKKSRHAILAVNRKVWKSVIVFWIKKWQFSRTPISTYITFKANQEWFVGEKTIPVDIVESDQTLDQDRSNVGSK